MLEFQPQNKPLSYHKFITCSVCAKGVEWNVAVPLLLLLLGKFFLQCSLGKFLELPRVVQCEWVNV